MENKSMSPEFKNWLSEQKYQTIITPSIYLCWMIVENGRWSWDILSDPKVWH
jgi:hypothetical protein